MIMAIIILIIVATKSCDIDSLMYASYFFVHFFLYRILREKPHRRILHEKPHRSFVFDAILRSYLHLDDAFSHKIVKYGSKEVQQL